MKKLIIALLFAQASCLSALPDWLNVDNLRKFEETVVQNSAKATKYCAEVLFTSSDKLNNFAAFIKNEATVDQVKTYAAISALLGIYLLYKSLPSKQRSSQPANAPSNLTGNK